MRIKFLLLSVLMGSLTLLLGPEPGRTQNPGAPPTDRKRSARPQLPPGSSLAPVAPADWVEERFRKLDRDGDGFLSFDEMTENLKLEKDKWDVNRDGMIDLAEWRAYVAAFQRAQQRRSPTKPAKRAREPIRDIQSLLSGRKLPIQDIRRLAPSREANVQRAVRPPFDESKLTRTLGQGNSKGARAVKLPNNVPAWFKEYDTDGDGQVSLREWKAREGRIGEFREYDLNGDGLITLEELIRSGQYLTGPNRQAPPTMHGSGAQFGDFFYYEVTGIAAGPVFGTDIYTIDSLIATTAVHAGLLRVGQTGFIKATLLPGEQSYVGSESNGVTSKDFGVYYKSFRVDPVP